MHKPVSTGRHAEMLLSENLRCRFTLGERTQVGFTVGLGRCLTGLLIEQTRQGLPPPRRDCGSVLFQCAVKGDQAFNGS
jgi:hypothetical protein